MNLYSVGERLNILTYFHIGPLKRPGGTFLMLISRMEHTCTVIMLIMICSITSYAAGSIPKIIGDDKLVIQKIADQLDVPAGLEFVGKDILIIHRNIDKVSLIRNLELKKYPVLDVNPFNYENESKLSGIALKNLNNTNYVLLFYSEHPTNKVGEKSNLEEINRIYGYKWNATGLELTNATLILDLASEAPATISNNMVIGPDDKLYTAVDDSDNSSNDTIILSTDLINQSSQNIFLHQSGFEHDYGYKIHNLSAMAFDPFTKLLWTVENSADGRAKIGLLRSDIDGGSGNKTKFSWKSDSLVTALTFMNSSALGNKFSNDLMVGDISGNIYKFELDKSRANIAEGQNLSAELIATGFGPISDLKIGTDGALYVLTLTEDSNFPLAKYTGSLYRVSTDKISLPLISSLVIRADYWGLFSTFLVIIILLILLRWYKIFSIKKVYRILKVIVSRS